MVREKRFLWMGLLLLLLAAAAAGCTTGLQPSASGNVAVQSTQEILSDPDNADRPTVVVAMKDFQFEPGDITVSPGTRIVFVNRDNTAHNIVEGTIQDVSDPRHDPLFASPDLVRGDQWELILDEEGHYDFACTIAGHYLMGMVGTITVSAGAEVADATLPEAVQESDDGDGDTVAAALTLDNLPPELRATPEGLAELAPFRVDGTVKEFALDIQEVSHELIDGVTVTAWAFNGILPGPTLRVDEGDLVRVHFTNTHHQPHTIHWHGIYADQAHDGVPHTSRAIMPGETYVYEFVAEDAGTFMYHCHVDSYRHIDMGMYGALIVDPKEPAAKTWDREYTLVLDDWDSEVDIMATRYEPDHNYFLVNGKAFPDVAALPIKVGETTRIRLINIGYNNFAMHMHGPNFLVVASDGHALPMPYRKDTLDIAPGERYDIEVQPTKAGSYPFHAHNIQYVLNNGLYPGGMHIMIDILDEDAEI